MVYPISERLATVGLLVISPKHPPAMSQPASAPPFWASALASKHLFTVPRRSPRNCQLRGFENGGQIWCQLSKMPNMFMSKTWWFYCGKWWWMGEKFMVIYSGIIMDEECQKTARNTNLQGRLLLLLWKEVGLSLGCGRRKSGGNVWSLLAMCDIYIYI